MCCSVEKVEVDMQLCDARIRCMCICVRNFSIFHVDRLMYVCICFFAVLVTNWDYKLFQLCSESRINTKSLPHIWIQRYIRTLLHTDTRTHSMGHTESHRARVTAFKRIKIEYTKQGLVSLCDSRRSSIELSANVLSNQFLSCAKIWSRPILKRNRERKREKKIYKSTLHIESCAYNGRIK